MKKTYGENFTYRDFAPLFKAELFDPAEWADLFKKSGARYVLLVSKHHDGYALWPSQYSKNWNSMEIGPKRDIVGELTDAVRNKGMRMGLYYSLCEWNNSLHRWYTDPPDSIAPYVEQYMIPQFKELVSTYKPDLIFSDGEWLNSAEDFHSAELISWYYNLIGPDAIVNNRWGGGSNIGFLTPEYSSGIKETNRPWAECRGLGRSFGLNRYEKLGAYMTPEELIHFFVKAVGYGGGITLNVGPSADGQIPLLQQERLIQLGKWLEINGEAIYGSKPWIRYGEEIPVTYDRIDSSIDFNWVRNGPMEGIKEDDFTITWKGYLQSPANGKINFSGKADDQMKVFIDDKVIIDTKPPPKSVTSGTVNSTDDSVGPETTLKLKKGKRYKIEITYRETKQNASARLLWKYDQKELHPIPESFFFLNQEGHEQGIRGTYRSTKQIRAYTTRDGNLYAIALEWPDDYLSIVMEKPSEGTKVELLGYPSFLPWKYEDGKIIIDVSDIKYSEIPGDYAWTFKLHGILQK